MKPHPSDLWKPPIVFEMVRARGMETIHQKRPDEESALCGLLPAETRRGRWTVYPALPKDAQWCKPCTIAAGTELAKAGQLTRNNAGEWGGWPFPESK